MRLLLLNLLFLSGVVGPLVVIHSLRSRVQWIERNHDWLSLISWALAIFVLLVFVIPEFGGKPDPHFFNEQF